MPRRNSCKNCLFYSDNGSAEGWCDFWNRMVEDTDICDHHEVLEEDETVEEEDETVEEIEYW